MSLIPRRRDIFDPLSWNVWDPMEPWPFRSLAEPNRFTDHIQSSFLNEMSSFSQTRIDWKETPTGHVFKADVPGLKKEELKVVVEDGQILQISGERKREVEEKNDTWHRVERGSGKFMRRFRLPQNANVDQVKAAMENGVLTVTVPKEDGKKSNVKHVQISG